MTCASQGLCAARIKKRILRDEDGNHDLEIQFAKNWNKQNKKKGKAARTQGSPYCIFLIF